MHICIDDYLLDIVQNSFEAGSSLVELTFAETGNKLSCVIRDNGKGMNAEIQGRVLDRSIQMGKSTRGERLDWGYRFSLRHVMPAMEPSPCNRKKELEPRFPSHSAWTT